MATLNGWQRLWVVLTVFWTVGWLSISYATWPSPSSSREIRELKVHYATLAEQERTSSVEPRRLSNYEVARLAERFGLSVANDENGQPRDIAVSQRILSQFDAKVERLQNSPLREPLSSLAEELDSARQVLRDDRVEHVQTTLMVWAIPPVVLYAFGWSAGWIRRGFRG
jgi:hypothetical protein